MLCLSSSGCIEITRVNLLICMDWRPRAAGREAGIVETTRLMNNYVALQPREASGFYLLGAAFASPGTNSRSTGRAATQPQSQSGSGH